MTSSNWLFDDAFTQLEMQGAAKTEGADASEQKRSLEPLRGSSKDKFRSRSSSRGKDDGTEENYVPHQRKREGESRS